MKRRRKLVARVSELFTIGLLLMLLLLLLVMVLVSRLLQVMRRGGSE